MDRDYVVLSQALHAIDAESPPRLFMAGNLTKCDPKGRNWNERQFVLRGRTLEYYKAGADGSWEAGELKGQIPLGCCGFLEVKNKKDGKFFQLNVGLTDSPKPRTHKLRCATWDECRAWQESIGALLPLHATVLWLEGPTSKKPSEVSAARRAALHQQDGQQSAPAAPATQPDPGTSYAPQQPTNGSSDTARHGALQAQHEHEHQQQMQQMHHWQQIQQMPPPSDDPPPALGSRSHSADSQDGVDATKPSAAEIEEHRRMYGDFTRQDAGATPGRILTQQQQQPKSILRARKASVTFGSPTVEEFSVDDSNSEQSASPAALSEEKQDNQPRVAQVNDHAPGHTLLSSTQSDPGISSWMPASRQLPSSNNGQPHGGRAAPSIVGAPGSTTGAGGLSASDTVERARALVESTRCDVAAAALPKQHLCFVESIH
jgi:hypothetical protein